MKKTKEKHQLLTPKRILLLAVLVLAVIYVIGAVFYSRHMYGKDTVFGVSVRNKTVSEVKDKIEENIKDYKLTVKTRTGDESIGASDIGLVYDDKGTVDNLKKSQRALLWFTAPFSGKDDLPAEVSYDEEKLRQAVSALNCMDESKMEKPKDAHLSYSDGSFQIVKETEGTWLENDTVLKALQQAVTEGQEMLDLDADGCYTAPAVYEDSKELKSQQSKVNKLLEVKITYDFGDRSEVVDSDLISQWITFGDNFTFDLDQEKVEAYEKELGYKYDTFGLSRQFKTSTGETITLKGGDYGWCIHKSKSAEALIEKILAGESGTIEPEYLYKGKDRNTNDIGGTYIEVSIARQRMWCYKDGKLIVDTPVVTGNINIKGRATPSGGVWAIDARTTDYYLTGEGYRSHVNFWLPFNGNVGIHDATWRDTFGGSIYKTNGSHGCVNTPYENAKKIYEAVTIGTPVVVY
ncbi:Uncharacterized vancomycin resistance protein [uncultured Roseburia sp.]|uniref:L,D-transpeptidase/peptidoglycan binding protein n=1 Tax=Brotonthovivens ammoniilytica TaxID=2981725 RepID=A0ABT2TFG0_9FIRM|nr:L,D-transpeptidase family protein [Brotonthovivens ammoniilytica]MCU6760933.1 L,D-transpeptidase/peptidoglycan binding protein [Brotonthovivens ammoniilytica]SCI13837.1 Uncharacterized vancomycin resistance protein [uncultured Roseburia sp.]